MASIMDYIRWRGDLSFQQSPFNEVDNLIFSELAYVELDHIVPGIGEGTITLQEASNLFFQKHTENELENSISIIIKSGLMMKEMAKAKRFCHCKLANYVNEIDEKNQSQFCAFTIQMDDGGIFLAFSGTDDSLIGWKESFNMSFMNETPSQLKAVKYLNRIVLPWSRRLRIGGHSRGGNLAIYAAVFCHRYIKMRITEIYNNDGPGFCQEFLDNPNYSAIKHKIRTIIPASSVIGMLLEHDEEYEIVKSSNSGILQHDALSWEVEGDHFIHVPSLSHTSLLLDKTVKSWLSKLSYEERENFVDTLYNIFKESNIETIEDFSKVNFNKVLEIWKIGNILNQQNEEALTKNLKILWDESRKMLLDSIIGIFHKS